MPGALLSHPHPSVLSSDTSLVCSPLGGLVQLGPGPPGSSSMKMGHRRITHKYCSVECVSLTPAFSSTLVTWAGPKAPCTCLMGTQTSPSVTRPSSSPQSIPQRPPEHLCPRPRAATVLLALQVGSYLTPLQMSSPQGALLLRLRMGHLLRLPQGGILSQALQVSAICLFLRHLCPTLYHQISWVTGGMWQRLLTDHQIHFTSFLGIQLSFTFHPPLQFSTSLGMSSGQWHVRWCVPLQVP